MHAVLSQNCICCNFKSPSTQVLRGIFFGSSTLVCVRPIHTFSIYFLFLLTTLMLQFMCFWIWLFVKNNFCEQSLTNYQCDDEWMVTRKAFYILKLGIWNWSVWRTGDVLTPLNGQKYGLVCFLTILLSVGSSQPNMDQIYWAKCAKQGLRMCWIRRPCNVPNIVTRRLQKLAQKRFDSVS